MSVLIYSSRPGTAGTGRQGPLTLREVSIAFVTLLRFRRDQYSRNDVELIQEVSNQIALAIKPFMPSVKACLPCRLFQESSGRSGRSVQGDWQSHCSSSP